MSSRSTVHWPCRYACCLLAGCTLDYRCKSLWIQKLYQSPFVDHWQEHWGLDRWCLQGGHNYSFLVGTMQAHAIHHKQKVWFCIPSAMVCSHYHMCVRWLEKPQIHLWRKQNGSFLRGLTTYATELTSMVCLLGAYILPFQIYAHAKTKEDQTATGLKN